MAKMKKIRKIEGPEIPAYDKEGDRHRRLFLQSLYERDRELNTEEQMLSEIMSKMRLTLSTVVQHRERLLLCTGGLGQHLLAHAPTLPELCGGTGPSCGTSRLGAIRKGHNSIPESTNKSLSRSRKRPGKRDRKKSALGSTLPPSEGDLEVYDAAGSTYSGPGRKPKPSQAQTYVRSAHLKPIRVGLTRHVDKLLGEMGMRTLIFNPSIIQHIICNLCSDETYVPYSSSMRTI